MSNRKVLLNMVSNWVNFFITILVAFIVSPILVKNLGNETYGIWVLVTSFTGYFTVLDFGVNTAIIRFISMHLAKKELKKANEVYSTSFAFFFFISVILLAVTLVIGMFFKSLFDIQSLSQNYLFFVFFVVGTDLAFSLLFSVFLGTLSALQEFLKINTVSITISLLKNTILVFLILNGFGLLAMAVLQLSSSLLRYLLQYMILRRDHPTLRFSRSSCKKSTLESIFSFSIYSFIIAVALKLLFYTDSIVIGRIIAVNKVPFYAIPGTILQYLEQFVWAGISVLVPLISRLNALGEDSKNKEMYIMGTKYSLALSLPVIFVLFVVGDDFISLWMNEEYGLRSKWVLKILLVGYVFSLSQLIAHGILKGISGHKLLAYVLISQAIVNLGLSIYLAEPFGIEGVALGTTIPLIISNLFIIPGLTCKKLNMKFICYLRDSYSGPVSMCFLLATIYYIYPISVSSYFGLVSYAFFILVISMVFAARYIIESDHRTWVLCEIKKRLR